MKKWILLAVLAFGAYHSYQNGYWFVSKGAFDEQGNPIARVFVAPGCGTLCSEVTALVEGRKVPYEVLDISTPEGQEYGVRRFPLTQVGNREVLGANRPHLVSALAENFGEEALTRSERIAMRNHFDERGQPVILMYGTRWCPWCKKQREYFRQNGIEYSELDAETSDRGKLAYTVLRGGGFPLTYVGYRRFDGYKPEEIVDALNEARAGR